MPYQPAVRGKDLLNNALLNKGTAFTEEERTVLGLHGLLPPMVENLDQQCHRAYEAYQRKPDDLERYIFLRALQDINEVLFYALLSRHMTEMVPVIYAPVVAQGCLNFSRIFRRPRGLFLSYPLRDRIEEMLDNRTNPEVDVLVVTDGERVLGIGDQGAGGMGISIAKLTIYTLIGGIDPGRTLPVLLDAGTNNTSALYDPEYLGWHHERIGGQDYYDFVDRFVQAVRCKLPHVLLQWEDFARPHARPLLDRYQDQLCTFNDDIQGTAAVVLGALCGAMNVVGKKFSQQKVVIFGAGGAGTGIADYLAAAMMDEGLSEREALERFYLVDAAGLIHTDMANLLPIWQKYARPSGEVQGWSSAGNGVISLQDVIRNLAATILIGVSTQPGQFTREIVQEMARKVERPIIFPLSNPDTRAEAIPADLIAWTDGRALVATGSPFPPVSWKGRAYHIAQVNNLYIFPAIGLGVVASGARRVTDGMLLAAARALGEKSPALRDPLGSLLPPLEGVHDVIHYIAEAVAREAQRAGHAPPITAEQLRARIQERFWRPVYEG